MTSHAPHPLRSLARAVSHLPSGHSARSDFLAALIALAPQAAQAEGAISEVLLTRELQVLEAFVACRRDMPWTRGETRTISIGTLAAELRGDLIAALWRAGFPIGADIHHMITASLHADNPAMLTFLREDYGYRENFWKENRFAKALEACGPGLAPHLLEQFLRHLASPRGRAMESFFGSAAAPLTWKKISAFLASGEDVGSLLARAPYLPAPLKRFVDMTGSNHGQLTLRGLEPDTLAVIGRSANAIFYGLPAADVDAMLAAARPGQAPSVT